METLRMPKVRKFSIEYWGIQRVSNSDSLQIQEMQKLHEAVRKGPQKSTTSCRPQAEAKAESQLPSFLLFFFFLLIFSFFPSRPPMLLC